MFMQDILQSGLIAALLALEGTLLGALVFYCADRLSRDKTHVYGLYLGNWERKFLKAFVLLFPVTAIALSVVTLAAASLLFFLE